MTYPFRSHIGNSTVVTAMNACAELCDVLDNQLKPYLNGIHNDDQTLKGIVDAYVDNVVLPTYDKLRQKTATLEMAVNHLANHPSTEAFKQAADAWIDAREPWETSEAFLFGPVDEKGLDPNMDSWPLDVDAIKDVMQSGKINELINWSEGDNEEQVEAVQNVRGFHTLEFLLFKDGKARTY
jgi:predicted lipoprotein